MKKGDIDRMARQQTEDYLRRSSVTYLECCIGLMLTHMKKAEVAAILKAQARLVRELG